jgi:hypothetical protein
MDVELIDRLCLRMLRALIWVRGLCTIVSFALCVLGGLVWLCVRSAVAIVRSFVDRLQRFL